MLDQQRALHLVGGRGARLRSDLLEAARQLEASEATYAVRAQRVERRRRARLGQEFGRGLLVGPASQS